MMISKNRNIANSEDSSLPIHHRRVCKFWKSLLPARKYLKLSTTTTPIRFRCVSNFWNSIHKFARKHFKRSTRSDPSLTTTTTRSDPSSTNPNIIIERSDLSSTNHNIIINSLPTLPFDLIAEILSRLPVKFLLQLRCVCKSWNSLISNDPNFAKKHLNNSTTTPSICSLDLNDPYCLIIYPPNFFFDTTVSTKRFYYHASDPYFEKEIVGFCNGIFCIAYKEFILLWNPSIRKINELPLLQKPLHELPLLQKPLHELPLLTNPCYLNMMSYGFGYDSVTDHYKVVVVLWRGCGGEKTQVKVNTLGTNIWKNIGEFPFGTVPDQKKSGKYLSGTINWLASSQSYIVSLDLGNESYQKLFLPDYGEFNATPFLALTLDVFRDCLCIISGHGHDVWLMKEYGKKESWTKLFTISYKQDPSLSFFLEKVIYVFEDGQVLLQMKMPFFRPQLIVYDPRIDTFKFVTFPKSFYDPRSVIPDVSKYGGLVGCMESLISPCS